MPDIIVNTVTVVVVSSIVWVQGLGYMVEGVNTLGKLPPEHGHFKVKGLCMYIIALKKETSKLTSNFL